MKSSGNYIRFCDSCKVCFRGGKRATKCVDCARGDAGVTGAVINQRSSDVDRLMRELQKANDRIAELERIGTNLWRVASGFRIDYLYDEGMDEIPIEEANPECVVYEYDHGDGIQAKHVIELNKALDDWNEVNP